MVFISFGTLGAAEHLFAFLSIVCIDIVFSDRKPTCCHRLLTRGVFEYLGLQELILETRNAMIFVILQVQMCRSFKISGVLGDALLSVLAKGFRLPEHYMGHFLTCLDLGCTFRGGGKELILFLLELEMMHMFV